MDMILVLKTVITGMGATGVMDVWSCFQKRILKVPPLNYALVGRWLLGLPGGTFCHHTIVSAPPLRGELLTGWVFHYLTGILFAVVPLMLYGAEWFTHPSLSTGLLAGLLTLFAPFLILQPALGFGIAASRTPRPWLARLFSVLTHLAYGVGLYIAASMMSV
ncbi:DUF2938 domain-containing protein [Lelliottia nimipressuralis]|uniref:DUF2938 domain-containing protein n=2 Tax=Lelliottia nimipressuralis TaxID=69220 RepID=A0ABD4KCB4_9ENTR|nr:DUF2938 family protein [Lelliottia nimipressuralis]MBF4179436.1 DUF2938 domain-containing protein [Lelliottia nimipressuralis]